MTEWTERVEAFLEELSVLTRKHGIAIGGCGCCGSPYLSDLTETQRNTEDWHYTVYTPSDKDSGDLEWEKEEA